MSTRNGSIYSTILSRTTDLIEICLTTIVSIEEFNRPELDGFQCVYYVSELMIVNWWSERVGAQSCALRTRG